MKEMHTVTIGRIGITLTISITEGDLERVYLCVINGKGFDINKQRYKQVDNDKACIIAEALGSHTLCSFESFLYPDQITEDEINLVKMMDIDPFFADESILYLCSYLVALWQGGADEETIHTAVDNCVESW